MKGDFSKNTFKPGKHFHDVLMQQGRVLLDAEWNEQSAITAYRTETGDADIIGKSGTPFDETNPDGGFKIIPVNAGGAEVIPPATGVNLKISKGHFYVDGILCENTADQLLFTTQSDYPHSLPTQPGGTYRAYLDVWLRHVTALDDGSIREVALGGPDTTTRAKTTWQVKLEKVDDGTTCRGFGEIVATGSAKGKMKARPAQADKLKDPCGLAESGGYRRLENQLYRVEIHKTGNKNTATFKYSIDNGSVIAKWESQDSTNKNILNVNSIGRDELLGFSPGNWIELIGDNTELFGNPGVLAKILLVENTTITIDEIILPPVPADGPAITTIDRLGFGNNPKIRRWDSEDPATKKGELKLGPGWIKLGDDGVEVEFDGTEFKSGDYWLIPARTATADVEWPQEPDPADPTKELPSFQFPEGITHHVAELAILKLETAGAAPAWSVLGDCRHLFPPITELTSLFYIGGDGQEGIPGKQLAQPLKVGVANGQWPVKNARVKFSLPVAGVGSLNVPADGIVFTDNEGKASCNWTLGVQGTVSSQIVEAHLLDAASHNMHLPVIFNAKLLPLTMFYVGGDGQEAAPGSVLPYPLKVGVAYEDVPVSGINVEFKITAGGGAIQSGGGDVQSIIVKTVNGVAECEPWKLGAASPQQVTATLFDAANNPMQNVQIIFSAVPVAAAGGKRKCSVTVGIGGDFETLDEAIEALSVDKIRDICICLLSPIKEDEHTVKNFVLRDKVSIKITGCGATIFLTGRGELSAETIVLHGFAIQTNRAAAEDSSITLRANEVNVNQCEFTSLKDVGKKPFILVTPLKEEEATTIMNWNENIIHGKIALALANGVSGWIGNNIIDGTLVLQYDGSIIWKKDSAKRIQEMIKGNVLNHVGLLNIHGNAMRTVITNASTIDPNSKRLSYKSLIVSQNAFSAVDDSFGGINSLVSEFINFADNQFPDAKQENLVQLVSRKSIVVGNLAADDNTRIQTFSAAGSVGSPPPPLNNVPVVIS
jgi:hypothetical protein